ncbi:hypothetical protein SAMN05878482_1011171 [Peribacillus simplex]|uniref:Uncharacterized protein n=1 Tax=Peribacillus simplex TaxID=1478 RepID=A0A9X8WIK5_9BACI|nr:hypothetical protein SAMN05878482_1011171 [Peribacillus simplex]
MARGPWSTILYTCFIQIKNQKGFGMKPFQNLFGYKLTHPFRISFHFQSLIAEFLQLGIGAELSGMPL